MKELPLAAIELLIDSMILTHDEESAAALMRSVHVRNIPHPVDLHLEIAAALEDHARMESAAEQYSLVLSEKVSDSERRGGNSVCHALEDERQNQHLNGAISPLVGKRMLSRRW